MIKNYALVALRSFYREKIYAAINVISLTLAVSCSLILLLYVRSELTYDQHHVNHDNIYRISGEIFNNGKGERFAITSQALGPLFLKEYPQIGEFTRFRYVGKTRFETDNSQAFWNDVLMADVNTFDVFTHEIVYGNPEDALVDTSSIAVSRSFAEYYFGDSNPIGKSIKTDIETYQIKLVFEDFPDNTNLKYDVLMSMNILNNMGQGDETLTPMRLFSIGFSTYFHLADGYTEQDLQRLLLEFNEKVMTAPGKQLNLQIDYHTQPLLDLHFLNGWKASPQTGNILYVYGFIAVAIFILLVACINYTNLATARAIKRAKEVGMRKVLGAEKSQLIIQFIGESVMYTILALIIGIICVEIVETVTPLAQLLGKSSLFSFKDDFLFIVWVVLGGLTIGVLAGIYPAFYLASIPPIASITARRQPSRGRLNLRQVLVFIQFLVSIGVVACTLIMALQMHYVANKPLGYTNENKVAVQLYSADTIQKIPVIRNSLLAKANILGVTETAFVPGQGANINLIEIENNQGEIEQVGLFHTTVGPEFNRVMDLEIIEGRDFAKEHLNDALDSVIVNETLVRTLGWDNPIGKQVKTLNAKVVGVVRDFHVGSLHEPIPSLILRPFQPINMAGLNQAQLDGMSRNITISIANDNIRQTLRDIESVISQFDPEHPFDYRFYDDVLNELYKNETNLMTLAGIFAIICIFISCLGLYGLSAFTTEQRTKEIGIRKVLGASTLQIILMLVKSQIVLVIIAGIIASTVSYFIMNNWLSTFIYRTDIAWWVFVVATLAVALIAFTTVAIQSSRTANASPIKALRYE